MITEEQLTQRVINLEKFMERVAAEVGCLPDYADSLPDQGNAHIIRKIQEMKSNDRINRPEKAKEKNDAET